MLTVTGLWVGKSGGRQAWVPASYFKLLSPIPTTVGGSVDRGSQDSQEPEVGKDEEKSSMGSRIDDFPRAFHNAIALKEEAFEPETHTPSGMLPSRIGATGNGMEAGKVEYEKPRYQLVDEAVGETVQSPTKLERAQKRSSMPKLLAVDKSTSEEQKVSVRATQIDAKTASPQLNRKFSWES
jgi:hypothetical protein